jgi:Zn-dependent protease with chaperone function
MRKVFFLFFFLITGCVFAQQFVPRDTMATAEIDYFLEDYKSRFTSNLEQVKANFSGETRRKIEKIYKEKYNDLVIDFEKSELYFESDLSNYLKKLVIFLHESNPELKSKNFNVHFSRTNSANAYSVGDGNIILNLELLTSIESEGELVAVLSHEMAHYFLDHRGKSVQKHVQKFTSKEVKKEIREIRLNRYSKQKRSESLLQDIVYSRKSKSRAFELEADSLGAIWFRKTGADSKYLKELLLRLSDSDKEIDSLLSGDYETFFTTNSQNFRKEWLEVEDFSKYTYGDDAFFKFDIDSLKTHPDCEERIKNLGKLHSSDTGVNVVIDAQFFKKLKSEVNYEKIFNLYYFKNYGQSLYESLKLHKREPENLFLLKMISLNLEALSVAKANLKLNSYIPTINPREQTESEQLFLSFMTNLSVNELKRIATDYRTIYQTNKNK